MELLHTLTDLILHFDDHLTAIIQQFGIWTYVLLFMIVFLETGVVIAPFLPGDSLLFVAGTLASRGAFDISWLVISLCIAAILGDTVNYMIGKALGPKVFSRDNSRFFKKEYLEKTRLFYEKYGGKAIILARFIPIIRTFAPFVAGVGTMHYGQFITYNIVGGIVWVTLFTLAGYFFGNLTFVQENFHTAVVAIILLSVVPVILEFIKHRREKKTKHDTTNFDEISKTFHKQHLSE